MNSENGKPQSQNRSPKEPILTEFELALEWFQMGTGLKPVYPKRCLLAAISSRLEPNPDLQPINLLLQQSVYRQQVTNPNITPYRVTPSRGYRSKTPTEEV